MSDMMVEGIFQSYVPQTEQEIRRATPKGNPTGSKFGTCTAQLQQLLYPSRTHPLLYSPRTRMTFEEGDRVEQWFAEKIREGTAGATWGLRQQPFYLSVPLEPAVAERLRRRLTARFGEDGRVWGKVRPGFVGPRLRFEGGVLAGVRGIGDDSDGIILDPDTSTGHFPLFIDGVLNHPIAGPSVVEIKSMSNYAFRKAMTGVMSYGNRCQLAAAVEATGLNAVWFAYRKETSHLGEIVMSRTHQGRVRIDIAKMNGQRYTYFSRPTSRALATVDFDTPEGTLETEGGAPAALPADTAWDMGAMVMGHEPALIEEIRERIRRVLAVEPENWQREYGPVFSCSRCGGTGLQTMQKGGSEPLKKAKACTDCNETGVLEETTLPNFPCGYCPVVASCYPMARLEIVGNKPVHLIRRDDYMASGLDFTPPAGYVR